MWMSLGWCRAGRLLFWRVSLALPGPIGSRFGRNSTLYALSFFWTKNLCPKKGSDISSEPFFILSASHLRCWRIGGATSFPCGLYGLCCVNTWPLHIFLSGSCNACRFYMILQAFESSKSFWFTMCQTSRPACPLVVLPGSLLSVHRRAPLSAPHLPSRVGLRPICC